MDPEQNLLDSLAEARELLQSMVLLSAVAGDRASKLRGVLHWLIACGLGVEDLAVRLDVSRDTLEALLSDDRPLTERMGISEESVSRLLGEPS